MSQDNESTGTSGVAEVPEVSIAILREHEVEKKMELIKQLTDQKENELKELTYLEAGHNLMYYDAGFIKGRLIQTAKEEPGESVLVVQMVQIRKDLGVLQYGGWMSGVVYYIVYISHNVGFFLGS